MRHSCLCRPSVHGGQGGNVWTVDEFAFSRYTARAMEIDTSKLIRKSMGFRNEVLPVLTKDYASPLIERIKENNFKLETGELTICLAHEFGFCYGVDRAVILAYETRKKFPNKRIFLTSEIIHNPQVNSKLKENGIYFLSDPEWQGKGFDVVTEDDVVIIPAFGTTTGDLIKLQAKGCELVDTTCGSVLNVWKRVDSYAQGGFTAIIHGKYEHEETRATSSRARMIPGGKFLVVLNMEQAEMVCDFISVKISEEEFSQAFKKEAMSEGFDPKRDLVKVGCANQTTMLSSESLAIANKIESAVKERYGETELHKHFCHFDTICSATQDRQDAIIKLVKSGIDLAIVIGGYNSSNTGHLVEIASEFCPSFHINDASEILSRGEIRHQPAFKKETMVTKNWLTNFNRTPSGGEGLACDIRIGVTAGASTPNRVMEDVIRRLLEITTLGDKR